MNANNPWERLSAKARQNPVPAAPRAELPFGFATRVLAGVRPENAGLADAVLRFSIRALPVGAITLLACWLAISPAEPPLPFDGAVAGAELADLAVMDALQK